MQYKCKCVTVCVGIEEEAEQALKKWPVLQTPLPRHFFQDTVLNAPDEECVVDVTPTRFSLW